MTQILQVGDIVRVNRPTPEGWGISNRLPHFNRQIWPHL